MWKIGFFKTMFIVAGLVGILLFAAPSLALLFHRSSSERFSELYVLGSGHMAEDYPFNVVSGASYMVFLGVIDHLGGSAFYDVRVKLRDSSELLPNVTLGVASPLPSLYDFMVFEVDGQAVEKNVTFGFSDVTFGVNVSRVGRITINNATYDVNKSLSWDAVNKGYYCEVFFELWLYDVSSSSFRFHDRFVGFWLNMTASV